MQSTTSVHHRRGSGVVTWCLCGRTVPAFTANGTEAYRYGTVPDLARARSGYRAAMQRRSVCVLMLSAAMVAALAGPVSAKSDPAADLAIAKQGVLTIGDFPSGEGWTLQGRVKSTKETLPSCQPVERAKEKYKEFRVPSAEYARGSNTTADNTVYVLPSVKDAKALLGAYKGPTERTCLQKGTEKRLAKIKGAAVDITRIDASGTGDDGVGFAVTLTAPTSQGTEIVVLDAVAYRIGRAVIGFTFRNSDEPLDIQRDLVAAATGRLEQALA